MRYINRLLNKANIILLLGLFGLGNYSTGQTLTASIATFDVANLSNSSEYLANSWLTEPLPLSLYSEQEKQHQQALNERLVDAVMTYSPSTQKSEWQSIDFEAITPYTWKWIDLELVHKDSSISKVSLRRPNWWILSVGADTVGDKVYINLPEMGIDGWASLTAIRANYLDTRFWNENRQGDYISRPITGKFEHQTKSYYNLYFENIAEPLGVTSTHPIWSLDRNTWVKVGDLKVGEVLKTQNGKVVLKSKDLIQQSQTVYNLEIYRDHNYSVSANRVLVHNTGGCPPFEVEDAFGGSIIEVENSPYLTVQKGNKTYHISEERVKEFIENSRNVNSRWGDQVNFKKYGVPNGSEVIKGAGKGHKRTPTPNELEMFKEYFKNK